MSAAPIGPLDETPETPLAEIEIDPALVGEGARFIESLSRPVVGEQSPLVTGKVPNAIMSDPRPAAVRAIDDVNERLSSSQSRLAAMDASADAARYDPDAARPDAAEHAAARKEVEFLNEQKAAIAAEAMGEDIFDFRRQWPWVGQWLSAVDDPRRGPLDEIVRYTDQQDGTLWNVARFGQGVAGSIMDWPGRLGDTIYDLTRSSDSDWTIPLGINESPYTRFAGQPQTISGSLGYFGGTYIAPTLLTAGGGAAAATTFGSKILAGATAGFFTNRAIDFTLDPVKEGSASAAGRRLIESMASSSDDPDFLDRPRIGGVTLRGVSDVLAAFDSTEAARREGPIFGRIAQMAEGAVLDAVLGPLFVVGLMPLGSGLKAAGRGMSAATAEIRRGIDAGAEAGLARRLGDLGALEPSVDPTAIIPAIDEAVEAARGGLQGDTAGLRRSIISQVDRYVKYSLGRLRAGDASAAETLAGLDAAGVARRWVLSREQDISAAARLSVLIGMRRSLQPMLVERAERARLSQRDPVQVVETTAGRTPSEPTRYQSRAEPQVGLDSGTGQGPLPAGRVDFTRVAGIDAERFNDGILAAKREHRFGPAVEAKPLEFYRDPFNRMWMSEDGSAGAVVSLDGDLVSVYKRPGSTADAQSLIDQASRHAITADAYDINGFLPSVYADHGFVVAARVKFNPEFAPPDWTPELGQPDIVALIRDPDGVTGLPAPKSRDEWIAGRDAVPLFDGPNSFNDAMNHREELMERHGIVDRMTTAIDSSPRPQVKHDFSDVIEAERMLDEMGLGLPQTTKDFEEYAFRLLIDPANFPNQDVATARAGAAFAARFGLMANGELPTIDQLRLMSSEVASKFIGLPSRNAKVMFQKAGEGWKKDVRATGLASEMISDMLRTPSGMRSDVDLAAIDGTEGSLLIRPRPSDASDLTTIKGIRFNDLPSLDKDAMPEMTGMRPITDDELTDIYANVVDEMIEDGMLPEALSTTGGDRYEEFKKWTRQFSPAVSLKKRSEWEARLGKTIREQDGVVGFGEIEKRSAIGIDPTDGMSVADIDAAASKGLLKTDEADWLRRHIEAKPAGRQTIGVLATAAFWNDALTAKGSDRGRFWYQVGSERLFGSQRPAIVYDPSDTRFMPAFSNLLSLMSARTAIDDNALRALHAVGVGHFAGRVPQQVESMGKSDAMEQALLGLGVADSTAYKVNNFFLANTSTIGASRVPFIEQHGRATMGQHGYVDLGVNDVVMTNLFNIDHSGWDNYTMYQFAVRSERRMRNLLNQRRAELEASSPLDGGVPREPWEIREVQAAGWTHYVKSNVDDKTMSAAINNPGSKLGLWSRSDPPPRAVDFAEATMQIIEVLRNHPDTRHYYTPGGSRSKFHKAADGTDDPTAPYMDGEVLSDERVWRIVQSTSMLKADAMKMNVPESISDRLFQLQGMRPMTQRISSVLKAMHTKAASMLSARQYTGLVELYTSGLDLMTMMSSMLLRNRDIATTITEFNGKTRAGSVIGELVSAVTGNVVPNPTAALESDRAMVRVWMQGGAVVDADRKTAQSLTPADWRIAGAMSHDVSGNVLPGNLVPLIGMSAADRRMAAAAMSHATGTPVSLFRYDDAAAVDMMTGAIKASEGNDIARKLNSTNVAIKSDAEMRTAVTIEIAHPKGNQSKAVLDDILASSGSLGARIFDEQVDVVDSGGLIMRLRGPDKQKIVDAVMGIREKHGITHVGISSLDPDSMTMTPGEAAEIMAEWRSGQMTKEVADEWFAGGKDSNPRPLSQRLQRKAVLIPTEWRERIIGRPGESAESIVKAWLRSPKRAESVSKEDLLSIIEHHRRNSNLYRSLFYERTIEQALTEMPTGKLLQKWESTIRKFDDWNSPSGRSVQRDSPRGDRSQALLETLGVPAEDASLFRRFQSFGGTIKGATFSYEGAGYAFIRGFNAADATTGIHELTHAIRVVSTSRGGTHKSWSESQWRTLSSLVGANGGKWTVEADENLADLMTTLMTTGRVPSGVPDDAAWTLSVLAAEVRDAYRDGLAIAANGVTLSEAMRDVMRRLDTMPLPIRVAPGKYRPAVDWSEMRSHAAMLRSQGMRWQDVIDPGDVLARARIFEVPGRPTLRDPVTGMFIAGTNRQRTLSDEASTAAMKGRTHFPKRNREEMFETMAYFEDFVRVMSRDDESLSPQSRRQSRDNALLMFGRLMNQPDDQITNMLDDLMRVDLRSDLLAERVMTVNMYMKMQLQDVMRQAKQAEKSGDALDYALLDREFRLFQIAHHHAAVFSKQLGQGLNALRDPIRVPTQDELRLLHATNRSLGGLSATQARGKDLVDMLRGMNVDDHLVAIARRVEQANASMGQRVRDAGMEVWSNALLSGPRTFIGISWAGPAMMTLVQGIERALGSAITGNRHQFGAVGRNLRQMIHDTMTAMRYASAAFKDEAPRFMATRGHLDGTTGHAITAESFGLSQHPAASLIDAAGQAIRLPSRFIMTADEFFRQLHGRQRIYMEAYDTSTANAVTAFEEASGTRIRSAAEVEEIRRANHNHAHREAEAAVDRMIRDGRLRTRHVLQQEALSLPTVKAEPDAYKRAMLVMRYMQEQYTAAHRETVSTAEDYATRATFQSQLGENAAALQRVIDSVPGGRIIVPFFRTPVNILKRFGGWLPTSLLAEGAVRLGSRRSRVAFDGTTSLPEDGFVARLHRQTLEDVLSGNPRRVAEARGRQAFGLGLVTLGYFLAANGTITGRGPTDPSRRRQWSRTNQPYSIRLGGGWVSYQKMDPVASTLGLMADAYEILVASEFSGGINEQKQDLVNSMIHAFGQQIRKAPYLQGIDQLMDALENEEKGASMVRNIAASAVPYSGMQRQIDAAFNESIKEVRSVIDSIRARTWFGDSDVVPTQRTPLGDPILPHPTNSSFWRWANLVNPMMYMQESDDVVYRTLNDAGILLSMPGTEKAGVDLAQVDMPGYAYSAYDWWMERTGTITARIGGREHTVRSLLTEYLSPDGSRHDEWRAMVAGGRTIEGESIAEQFVKTLVGRFQTAAYNEMAARNPAVAELQRRIVESKKDQSDRFKSARPARNETNADLRDIIGAGR